MNKNRKTVKVTLPGRCGMLFDQGKKRAEFEIGIVLSDAQYASRVMQWALDLIDIKSKEIKMIPISDSFEFDAKLISNGVYDKLKLVIDRLDVPKGQKLIFTDIEGKALVVDRAGLISESITSLSFEYSLIDDIDGIFNCINRDILGNK